MTPLYWPHTRIVKSLDNDFNVTPRPPEPVIEKAKYGYTEAHKRAQRKYLKAKAHRLLDLAC